MSFRQQPAASSQQPAASSQQPRPPGRLPEACRALRGFVFGLLRLSRAIVWSGLRFWHAPPPREGEDGGRQEEGAGAKDTVDLLLWEYKRHRSQSRSCGEGIMESGRVQMCRTFVTFQMPPSWKLQQSHATGHHGFQMCRTFGVFQKLSFQKLQQSLTA